MKRVWQAVAFTAAMTGAMSAGSAMAAPPTVVPSPGYDARLQEQRAALQRAELPCRVDGPVYRRTYKPHRAVTRGRRRATAVQG